MRMKEEEEEEEEKETDDEADDDDDFRCDRTERGPTLGRRAPMWSLRVFSRSALVFSLMLED